VVLWGCCTPGVPGAQEMAVLQQVSRRRLRSSEEWFEACKETQVTGCVFGSPGEGEVYICRD